MLSNLDLKFKYDSDSDNLIDSFYIPVLSNSIEYYRMSGFFSSSSLAISAQGIREFILNNGKMKLLCSAKLSEEDFNAICEGSENPDKFIEKSFRDDLFNLEDGFIKDQVEALGWMIANGFLEIKIAIPKNNKGIFHSKVGIMKDEMGNLISFSGSDNETAYGWMYNIEEFKVFKSWVDGEKKFVDLDFKDFDRYWSGNTNKTNVLDLPEAIKKELIELAPSSREDLNIFKNKKSGNNLKLRDYQNEAIDAWFGNNCHGLFEMATGTGKTFTALSCFKKLYDSKERLITIIACPQSHLIDQWIDSVEKFYDGKILIASGKNHNWRKDFKKLSKQFYFGLVDKAVIMTTHRSLSSEYFINCIEKFKVESLLIVDEVHGIGSSKQLNGLLDKYDFRLGLSATPERWFDSEGTQLILDYFEGVVFEFDIERALSEINPDTGKTYLTPYRYYPIIVDLNNEELEEYSDLTKKITHLWNSKKDEDKKLLDAYLNKRRMVVNNAESKYHAFKNILDEKDLDKLIVFCSPQQINRVQKILNNKNIVQHKFTQKESANKSKGQDLSQREKILADFKEGFYKALVAIKCLDEGVDIPSAENAIILSSTTNPREHVQRRGRILRNSPGKNYADIYDLLVFPKSSGDLGSKIMKNEIERYMEFAENAENSWDCVKILKDIM